MHSEIRTKIERAIEDLRIKECERGIASNTDGADQHQLAVQSDALKDVLLSIICDITPDGIGLDRNTLSVQLPDFDTVRAAVVKLDWARDYYNMTLREADAAGIDVVVTVCPPDIPPYIIPRTRTDRCARITHRCRITVLSTADAKPAAHPATLSEDRIT